MNNRHDVLLPRNIAKVEAIPTGPGVLGNNKRLWNKNVEWWIVRFVAEKMFVSDLTRYEFVCHISANCENL